jgi:hypothetical protein
MNKILLLGITFTILATAAIAADKKEEWAAAPKETTFKEFKMWKANHHDGKVSTFDAQATPAFKLTKPFDGDATKICYGVTKVDAKTQQSFGIACVMSAVGAKTCKGLALKKCSDDDSLAPL